MELQSKGIHLSSELGIDLKKISTDHSDCSFSSDIKSADLFKEQNERLHLHTVADTTVSPISPHFSGQPLYIVLQFPSEYLTKILVS